MKPELVGVTEVAAILGKSRATIKRWALHGTLPPVIKMPGETGAYLFDRAVVEALAEDAAA